MAEVKLTQKAVIEDVRNSIKDMLRLHDVEPFNVNEQLVEAQAVKIVTFIAAWNEME